MRRIENFSVGIFVFFGLIGFFSSPFGDVEGAGEWDWVAGLAFVVVGLSFYAFLVKDLKKQGCPNWCSSDTSVLARRRFHRFGDAGETDDGLDILECSRCGARRNAPKWMYIP